MQSQGELLSVRVPSAEAGAPQRGHLFQGRGPYELIHQCLQEHHRPGILPGALQPTLGHDILKDPEDHAPTVAQGAGQTRHVGGHRDSYPVSTPAPSESTALLLVQRLFSESLNNK